MAEDTKLNRRSFLNTVAGAAVGGAALAAIAGGAAQAQQRPTGRSDSDSGQRADRGGYGRTGVTDTDPYDMPGRGVGRGGGRPATGNNGNGRTDRDPTDRPGRGYSGRSDSDSGSAADRAGHGR